MGTPSVKQSRIWEQAGPAWLGQPTPVCLSGPAQWDMGWPRDAQALATLLRAKSWHSVQGEFFDKLMT